MKKITNIFARLLPTKIRHLITIVKILYYKYGYSNSFDKKLPCDDQKEPLPWYTYPAIEYLSQLNLAKKSVFEYGTGNSSLFFAKKCASVISVEDNQVWFDKMNQQKPKNLRLLFEKEEHEYLTSIEKTGQQFDIIVIDASYRMKCCAHVKKHLKEGGVVILDNSDWFNDAAQYLRDELNLIQVDFFGFGPINDYTWCTSLFFDRKNKFITDDSMQPKMPIGGIK